MVKNALGVTSQGTSKTDRASETVDKGMNELTLSRLGMGYRQLWMALALPNDLGSAFHWQPVRST